MSCRELCIERISRKEYPLRCGAWRANSCCECQDLKEKSSRFPIYDGAAAPTEFVRGMKNRMAAGVFSAANFFRKTRGEASSISFKSDPTNSAKRLTRYT